MYQGKLNYSLLNSGALNIVKEICYPKSGLLNSHTKYICFKFDSYWHLAHDNILLE